MQFSGTFKTKKISLIAYCQLTIFTLLLEKGKLVAKKIRLNCGYFLIGEGSSLAKSDVESILPHTFLFDGEDMF
jgi:hypothetical protein